MLLAHQWEGFNSRPMAARTACDHLGGSSLKGWTHRAGLASASLCYPLIHPWVCHSWNLVVGECKVPYLPILPSWPEALSLWENWDSKKIKGLAQSHTVKVSVTKVHLWARLLVVMVVQDAANQCFSLTDVSISLSLSHLFSEEKSFLKKNLEIQWLLSKCCAVHQGMRCDEQFWIPKDGSLKTKLWGKIVRSISYME